MEMPANLKTLPPEAIDILRFYGQQGKTSAFADDIMEGAGLSPRGFGKFIRRLVTQSYVTSDGGGVYRLTDLGRRSVEALASLGDALPARSQRARTTIRVVRRRLVMGVPRMLTRAQPTNLIIGFEEAGDDDLLKDPVNLLLRINLVNGEPSAGRELTMLLSHRHTMQMVEITAGAPGSTVAMARIRVEVKQLSDFTGEYEDCGGMFVDIPISASAGDAPLIAYGTDIEIQGEAVED